MTNYCNMLKDNYIEITTVLYHDKNIIYIKMFLSLIYLPFTKETFLLLYSYTGLHDIIRLPGMLMQLNDFLMLNVFEILKQNLCMYRFFTAFE